MKKLLVLAAALLLWSSVVVLADPPSRVGRVGFIEGMVNFRDADQDDWTAATLNYPVTGGDALSTGDDARTEIQIENGAVRLDRATELEVPALDDQYNNFRLLRGTVSLSFPTIPEGGPVTVETGRGTVHLLSPGRYRIEAGDG